MRGSLELIERYDPRLEVPLRVGEVPILVRTNSAPVAAALTEYFRPWTNGAGGGWERTVYAIQGRHGIDPAQLQPVKRETGKAPKEAYRDEDGGRVVLKVRTGVGFFLTSAVIVVVGDLERELGQLVNLVGHIYADTFLERGYVMLHASAVQGERGIAFAAQSGAGKSTMALALIERGYRFVTNDRLLIRAWGDRVEMVGLPKMPRVNPGTLLRLPALRRLLPDTGRYSAMDRAALWSLEEKRDVRIPEVFGTDPEPHGGLDEIYLLEWTPAGTGFSLRALEPAALAYRMWRTLRTNGIFGLRPEPREAWRRALAMAAPKLRGFEVRGLVDVDLLADALERRVRA